jgi:choline dehydrogenase
MQRGFPEDFDSWAALGNDEWSYDKILPYFRKSEHDLDIQDDCHGSDGPMPVRRRQTGPWPTLQQAFHAACVQAGFGTTEDTNGRHPAGLGVSPSNNIGGVRMSTAMTHLNPVRHHLNLTVRGGVFVRRVLIKNGEAVGVEAESGGKVFHIEAGRVVLSAGAIRSPHLLMLSGIGPKDHLREFGIPTVCHLPGVGQNLWNHLSAQMTFKVKDGVSLDTHTDAAHFSLHYTARGSTTVNDMVLRTSPVVDERRERVPGVRTRYLSGDVAPEQDMSGCRQQIPALSLPSTTVTCSTQTTCDGCGKACDWQRDCLSPPRIETWPITGYTPGMTFWLTTMLWIFG